MSIHTITIRSARSAGVTRNESVAAKSQSQHWLMVCWELRDDVLVAVWHNGGDIPADHASGISEALPLAA